jgi:YidC/Oxa1 family membrane protein insertase
MALCLGPGLNLENTGIREPGLAYAFTDGNFKKLKKKGVEGRVDWAGVSNRFFLMAYLSKEPAALDYVKIYSTNKKSPIIGIGINKFELRPGEKKSIRCELLVCPKAHDVLEPLGRSLTKSIDFGVFAPISKFFIFLLNVFNIALRNYGVAIILLTIVIYGILSPFTFKSYRSMDKMRVLQPKIKELQQKYKGDSQRLNIEMMNLYKTQKVNPLGGCLPMLLQVPVLFGLFMTLRNAVELRGAPFVWWINDLSAPETLFSLTLFPFGTFPVRALPLIMGITMFIQQKLSASGDLAQSRIMLIMPVMMVVLFWNFPSGLVLYFLVSNLLGMLQQWLVRRASAPAVAH